MIRGLPLADATALARRARLSRVLRVGLAAGLAVVLALGIRAALRGGTDPPRLAPPGKTSVLVLDVSSSVAPTTYRQIEQTLAHAIASGERYGLVMFSDEAYELLPPGTKAAELDAVRRYFLPQPPSRSKTYRTFRSGNLAFPVAPWTAAFTNGTHVSRGLILARAMLRRDHVTDGQVILVSDLEDDYLDIPLLARTLEAYGRERLPLHVIGLNPQPYDRQVFRQLIRGPGSVSDAALPGSSLGPTATVPPTPFPVELVVLALLLVAAVGLNEHLLVRLPLGPGEGVT